MIVTQVCLGFPVEIFFHENCAKIAQRFAKVSSKNCTKCWCFCPLMCKSYSAQILEKILVFANFIISYYFVILSYLVISLNFEKQFLNSRKWWRNSKLQAGPVNNTPARSALTPAGLIGPNSQVLGHQTIPFKHR